jgi:hypothetical protein
MKGKNGKYDFANTMKKVKSDLRKLPVLRLNFPRPLAREIFRLSTGIFRKYSSQA